MLHILDLYKPFSLWISSIMYFELPETRRELREWSIFKATSSFKELILGELEIHMIWNTMSYWTVKQNPVGQQREVMLFSLTYI